MRNLQNGLPAMGEAAFRRLGNLVGGRYFLGCCYVAVAAAVCYRVLQGTFMHHNSVRLARSYALVHGFDIYPGRDSGALTGIIYGPVGILSYWPAAFFPSPRSALVCGVLLSIGMSFLPIYLLFRNPRITGDAPRGLAGLLFCAVFFHFYWSPADTGVWQIHGDAPAFMLCGLAGYFAVVHGSSRAFSWPLAGSALCAALAPWSKQSYVPIVFVIPVYLLVLGNKRAAVWFLASATGISALLGGLFSAIFGVEDLVLAMFLVPSRHPLNFERLFDAVRMITFGWVGLAMLTVLILVALHSQEGSRPGVSPAVRADWSVWPLFILTGLCMAPTAILGRVKSSGWVNADR